MILLAMACTGVPSSDACDACGGDCLQETVPVTSRQHVEGEVAYDDYPPTGGDHNACWAEWGVHKDVVPAENWVHNMEHGGVVFLYASTLEAEDLAALQAYVAGLPEGRALLSQAEEDFGGVVAVVAWQHRMILGCYDETTVDDFFWDNLGHAPEDTTAAPGSCM